jgi:phosphopantetheinyl transferase
VEEETEQNQQFSIVENPDFLTSKVKMYRGNQEHEFSIAFVRDEMLNSSSFKHLLHDAELSYLQKLTYERRRRSYTLGRLSAKLAVKKLTNNTSARSIHIGSGVFGFPIVCSPNVTNTQVSITHSGPLGVSIAFEEKHPMGIDLEKIRPDNDKVILNQISQNEKALLQNINKFNLEGFTSIWCAKEALSKILKTGMMINFSFLEIDNVEMNLKTITYEFKNFGQYKALCYTNEMYALALVLPKKTAVNLEDLWATFNLSTVLFNETTKF